MRGLRLGWRSPCARWKAVDQAVHVRLAASIEPHHPEVARGLRSTSPHFAGQRPAVEPARLTPVVATVLAVVIGRGAILVEHLRRGS